MDKHVDYITIEQAICNVYGLETNNVIRADDIEQQPFIYMYFALLHYLSTHKDKKDEIIDFKNNYETKPKIDIIKMFQDFNNIIA